MACLRSGELIVYSVGTILRNGIAPHRRWDAGVSLEVFVQGSKEEVPGGKDSRASSFRLARVQSSINIIALASVALSIASTEVGYPLYNRSLKF